MGVARRVLLVTASFAVALLGTCVANFGLQLAMIFLDVVTRLEESAGAVLALWFVTGVFTTVFVPAVLEPMSRQRVGWQQAGTIVLALCALVLVATVAAMVAGWAWRDPRDFSLLTENPWNVLACFLGAGAMAAVLRHVEPEPAPGGDARSGRR